MQGWVCLGPEVGFAPPLLAGVLGCAFLCARSACTPPLLARVCGVGVCAWARALAAPRHSWLGCGVWMCVLGLGFRLRPATLGWGVGVCVCLCARSPLVPRLSWLGCAACVCVLGLGLRLRLTTAGWGVGSCVCLCARSACTPPLLAGVCCVGVCAWARVSAASRNSSLGCAVWVCMLGLGLWLRPATPGWGVGVCPCLCLRSACTPPLLAGVCGVGVCAWAWVSAVPTTPGCGFGVCVFVCASACSPPLLAGVCSVGVCAWARVLAAPRHSSLGCGVSGCVLGLRFLLAPRHSWLGCWGVCVFVCALLACTLPFLAGECGVCVCVLGLGFWLRPATPGWGVGGCVCLCARSACTPPLLALVCCVGVCAWARISASPHHSWLGCWGLRGFVRALLVPRDSRLRCALWACVLGLGFSAAPCHSWLQCAVWVCVLGLGSQLRPATPGWGVEVCLCLCVRSTCTPPLLAGVHGVDVCA